ncbi:ABC transporter ATP-binding protein [Bacillus horti]|uniref:Oligopeptide/dipeptide ABC transporter ATP-binding protein n=1 Tax=Caldalkalibacillus horti TaxID=77523 RepID=A0ABT9VY64_9BACI|nr:oligopeptide/dipeptide ABC transporter ATP-binding protein [Bacillus horti]MDQ0165940.1 oligopeptide/dipeptide ABC transporter ATP-binding protein [Bacillus horti]
MAERSVIEVKDLQKHFPVRRGLFSKETGAVLKAVDGVSFSIKKGQSLGLAGESGCGKTTTGKMLLQLYEPTGGSYLFNNEDVTHLKSNKDMKKFRKQAQLMFQNPFEALNPRFTIYRSLLEPLINHGIGSKEECYALIKEALERVNLQPAESYFEKYPYQMSGGQLQRVVLARALIIDPVFLVADEPVSMLDVSVRAGVLNLMKSVTESMQLTTVYISHDLSLIQYMCEQTAIMYLGRIVEIGDTKTILESPKHPYTQALISAVPVPDPEHEPEELKIHNHVPSPINLPKGCHFQDRCPYVESICRQEDPQLKEAPDGIKVSCHMVHEHKDYLSPSNQNTVSST